tara:strand:+ start:488 stop:634 length:147 start_codon:yes stop_codon:yes gene_type:complete
MNKTNAEDDNIHAVSPELTWACAFVDIKETKKIEKSLNKTSPFFLHQY